MTTSPASDGSPFLAATLTAMAPPMLHGWKENGVIRLSKVRVCNIILIIKYALQVPNLKL